MNINNFIIWHTTHKKWNEENEKQHKFMYLCEYIYNHTNEANAYYFNYNTHIDTYVMCFHIFIF